MIRSYSPRKAEQHSDFLGILLGVVIAEISVDFFKRLDTQARLDRVIWLCVQFGLPELSQEILNLLEQVLSPVPLDN